MQELNQLNVNEAHEFLDEFISHVLLAVKAREERRIEKEKIEALEKVKLIERQFPGLQGVSTTREIPISPALTKKVPIPTEAATPIKIGINKIDTLLADPDIDLIECSDGKIKIRKNAKIQETGFMMSEREIGEVINKFSEKTKMPLVDNFLRASLGNLSINAIISELIGSRFLISKKV